MHVLHSFCFHESFATATHEVGFHPKFSTIEHLSRFVFLSMFKLRGGIRNQYFCVNLMRSYPILYSRQLGEQFPVPGSRSYSPALPMPMRSWSPSRYSSLSTMSALNNVCSSCKDNEMMRDQRSCRNYIMYAFFYMLKPSILPLHEEHLETL